MKVFQRYCGGDVASSGTTVFEMWETSHTFARTLLFLEGLRLSAATSTISIRSSKLEDLDADIDFALALML